MPGCPVCIVKLLLLYSSEPDIQIWRKRGWKCRTRAIEGSLLTVIRLGSVDSTHVQTTPVHNGNVFANYVNSTKFDEVSHLKMNPNSITWHSGRIDHFRNIFLLTANLELNLNSVKVNSLSRFKRCGNLANCYTLVTYFTGVGTMGTGGYIVPPKFRTCTPCTPEVKDAAYVKILSKRL